ncbi:MULTISPECIES: ABC transporter ATP-binding protein [unclassified Brevundimonas]|mgnify:FL=1|jgi:ABC-2 type transport system ATP-binding protein|uniref:ABC transporter ATP-binding protein n=1 Tax=unclassified Brevundimonas TaxID=2622653 RepID=UPI000E9DFCF1|nr:MULTISPECIES: ABC transporter ATP-binding protein [unclassified Brevundimonas]HAJ02912.1 ABC transporter ATP-binding protein [Brevundimonas sp.]HAV49604.1 ABC transporter ATP-binding protein [Brevundimonas sp.]|tara:strand:+ start:94003 stop:94932 length:930 start_codon:yes stop_codon:yes gene_type:complete
MLAIETRDLRRRFGPTLAVDGVSLSVPRGCVYGFMGRNGAGKTTTLKMLLGLVRPDAGTIYIAGRDALADRLGAARCVGALLEAHGFYAHLSGRENLDLTRSLLGLRRSELDRVLDIVGLTPDAGRRVGGYSLGMRQRLGIARALLGSPEVLILDEPTNGLDPDGIADMRDFLRTLPARANATVLLSSHLLGEVEQVADRVGIIHQGRLVLQDDLATLRAGQAPQLRLGCDAPDRARALILSMGLTPDPDSDRITLAPGADVRETARALNRGLVEAGIGVHELTPQARSLETIYRDITALTPPAQKEAA